ncbi:MAG: DUF4236 domain-containing protein [Candidatus Symbiothrix sp.]|jgi:hypothetical protein|nr:DUF4236 domain-containing protein [Candidatus Symbiothrix sp.]
MGLRFRKTIKLMPGVKLNLSKGGISTTIGSRGFSVTSSKRGTYLNAGISGTGLSSRTNIGKISQKSNNKEQVPKEIKPISRATYLFCKTMAFVFIFVFVLLSVIIFLTGSKVFAIIFLLIGLFISMALIKSSNVRYNINRIKDNNITTNN